MEIFAIPGSIRVGSYNLALLNELSKLSPHYIGITVFDNIKNIPIFCPEIANSDIPQSVNVLMSQIRKCDAIIISTPEYAHGISGVLKNTLDWLVSSDVLVIKPVLVTSVSTSGLGGVKSHGPLVSVLSAMNCNVIVEGSINVPFAQKKFDGNGNLTDPLTKNSLINSLSFLERAINDSV